MGQLPACRVASYVRPFSYTGIDYFGLFEVTIGRRHEKRWVVLFTCLTIRAIHLEIAGSLSTDSCILAIRRFISRRGSPMVMYSNNGTNFVGTYNELNAAIANLDQDAITLECTKREISWCFNPPAAPHMGGGWESLVKSVKIALRATMTEKHPREEVFTTLIAEAERTVNEHQLTHVPVDPDDHEALTPNHLLLGGTNNNRQWEVPPSNSVCPCKMWRIAQNLANEFWRRWIREYLPTLLRRIKWTQRQTPIEIGDVVLEVGPHLPRSTWPKGAVTEIYPGSDGITRVVDIRMVKGTYRRQIGRAHV